MTIKELLYSDNEENITTALKLEGIEFSNDNMQTFYCRHIKKRFFGILDIQKTSPEYYEENCKILQVLKKYFDIWIQKNQINIL